MKLNFAKIGLMLICPRSTRRDALTYSIATNVMDSSSTATTQTTIKCSNVCLECNAIILIVTFITTRMICELLMKHFISTCLEIEEEVLERLIHIKRSIKKCFCKISNACKTLKISLILQSFQILSVVSNWIKCLKKY